MPSPSYRRILAIARISTVIAIGMMNGIALAQETVALSEDHVARAALLRFREQSARRRARVGAGPEAAGVRANPELSFERQQAFAPNPQTQDLLALDIPFEISGRVDAERALAEAEVARNELELHQARLRFLFTNLSDFYRVIAARERTRLRHEHLEALESVLQVIEARVAAGDAASLDQRRTRVERELLLSEIAEERANAAARELSLKARLSLEGQLVGELRSRAPGAISELLRAAEANRHDVHAMDLRNDYLEHAAHAAERAFIPPISLRVGYFRPGPPAAHGLSIGASVELPFFDRGQTWRAEARASRESLGGERDAYLADIRGEILAARQQVLALREELERFEGITESESLLEATLSAYAEGERSVFEVLDVHRLLLETKERMLHLQFRASIQDLRLRIALGMFDEARDR